MDLSDLQTDPKLTSEGVWVEFGDARFKIRSIEDPSFQKAATAWNRKYPAHIADRAEHVARNVYADAVLLDFEGITDKGAPLPNTRDNRVLLLRSKTISDFVAAEAQNLANFRTEAIQAEADLLKSRAGVETGVGAE